MFGPMQLTPGRATLLLTLMVLLVVGTIVSTYRYATGGETAEQYYLKLLVAASPVPFLLSQASPPLTGWIATVVEAFTYVAILVLLVAGVQCWRFWGTDDRPTRE